MFLKSNYPMISISLKSDKVNIFLMGAILKTRDSEEPEALTLLKYYNNVR